MKYFNGFSLKGEEEIFKEWLPKGEMGVAGFSYGAQQALEYAYTSSKRIERLVLISPAFFQEESRAFVRTQLRYFQADKEAYLEQFLANVAYPASSEVLRPYLCEGAIEDLEALLSYQWEQKKIESLLARGVEIEVLMGMRDKIVKSEAMEAFFKRTTNYCFKDAGHLLLREL